MKRKLNENTQPIEAELEIETLDGEHGAEVLTSNVLEEIAELADDMTDVIFRVGSANIPEGVRQKVSTAHETLLEAYESLSETVDDESGEVAEPVNEAVNYTTVEIQSRVRDLAILKIIDRAAVNPVIKMIKDMQAGNVLNSKQREIAITLLAGLIDVVTGDLVFASARREVNRQAR